MFGDSIAGQNYSLQCSASVVDGVVVQPDLEIVGPGGSVLASVGQNVTLTHMFSPLVTFDGGQYTCTATLNIPEAGITNLQGSAVKSIIVIGKLLHVMVSIVHVCNSWMQCSRLSSGNVSSCED